MTLIETMVNFGLHIRIENCFYLAKNQKKTLAVKRGPTLFNLLFNGKNLLSDAEKPGIYKIPVHNKKHANQLHILEYQEETGTQSLDEHKQDVLKGKLTTALAIKSYTTDL